MDKSNIGNCIYVGGLLHSWWIAEYPNNSPLSGKLRILKKAPYSLKRNFGHAILSFFKAHSPYIIWEDTHGNRSFSMALDTKLDTSALSFLDSLLFRMS